jgi:Amt family ammonium transporter
MIAQTVNSGDTAWLLICAALVLFMTPGLAFFYAGMVRSRNSLVMMQQNFIPLGVVSVTWVLVGYSLAFGNTVGNGLVGDLGVFGLRNLIDAPSPGIHVVSAAVSVPTLAFVAYQMMFAIITPALATGAVADRMKFAGWACFLAIWSVVVYAPIAHWLWAPAGWLTQRGAQDWAGGMVVHASAGAAALALLIVLGKRTVWPDAAPMPHSIPLVIVGAGILWFGWFGFNAGDGLQANGVAAQALINTHVAGAVAMLVWLVLEKVREGHPTVIGGVTGAVAGLATITPAAGYVSTLSALMIGVLAGLVCHVALRAKTFFKFDDALDVIAVHFVGGILGTLLVGFFGEAAINDIGADGLFFGGGAGLLGWQIVALVSVIAFSFCLSWLIASGIEKTIGLRVDPADEGRLDQAQQGMDAYHFGQVVGLGGDRATVGEAIPTVLADHDGPVVLVTAIVDLDDAKVAELKEALVRAGASRIVATEAHVFSGGVETVTIRNQQRAIDFAKRARIEVLAPRSRSAEITAAFEQFASGDRPWFTVDVDSMS